MGKNLYAKTVLITGLTSPGWGQFRIMFRVMVRVRVKVWSVGLVIIFRRTI